MDNFNTFIEKQFKISIIFLFLGLFFGILYSINLLGVFIDSTTLNPVNIRILHISLMLYGFVPLMLSYLPFLLINKEVGSIKDGLFYLNLYTIFWYIFLIFMISCLLFGNTRGLAFYDFPYELNFILAFAGLFYIIALYKYIKQYKVKPTWVKVSLYIVTLAPFTLLILMNPTIGQVESTISGPHGDNTLGMSFALIPIYYLIIKLLNKEEFKARWNIFWMIPLAFYILSVLHRSFIGSLSYNQEWFFQYLTLLYIPLLYRWYKDSNIDKYPKLALLISILAFLFVDIEGNILFIPELRWVFHRNDLVVAHAHVAMGIGVFFMVIAMFVQYIKQLQKINFYILYLFGLLGIFIVLSISGFIQAGMINGSTQNLWVARTIFGIFTFLSLIAFVNFKFNFTTMEKYNLFGVLNDGFGGVFLILLASFLYPILDFSFEGKYEYIVFAFVSITGLIHFLAFKYKEYELILTKLTVLIRVFISSVFFALYMSHTLGVVALVISLFDISMVIFYLLTLYKKEQLCKN
ncbi:cbb3-type cytochrome c oxidase subunit I [Malaciobacter mytili]|uniref:cbb3-type cytochrome c oxidase subunit I n=1 Tax=Malaciobacter mytili TaxID=603050 RepID=UPI003BAE46DB